MCLKDISSYPGLVFGGRLLMTSLIVFSCTCFNMKLLDIGLMRKSSISLVQFVCQRRPYINKEVVKIVCYCYFIINLRIIDNEMIRESPQNTNRHGEPIFNRMSSERAHVLIHLTVSYHCDCYLVRNKGQRCYTIKHCKNNTCL